MSIGFRKIFRDLWRSKGRTALAVLSIFIGVFAVGMVSGIGDMLPSRMIGSYRATNPAHIRPVSQRRGDRCRPGGAGALPGIAGVEGLRGLGARWRTDASQPLRNMDITVYAPITRTSNSIPSNWSADAGRSKTMKPPSSRRRSRRSMCR